MNYTSVLCFRNDLVGPESFGIPWFRTLWSFRCRRWRGIIRRRMPSIRFFHFRRRCYWRNTNVVSTSSHESSTVRTICPNWTGIWNPICWKPQFAGTYMYIHIVPNLCVYLVIFHISYLPSAKGKCIWFAAAANGKISSPYFGQKIEHENWKSDCYPKSQNYFITFIKKNCHICAKNGD